MVRYYKLWISVIGIIMITFLCGCENKDSTCSSGNDVTEISNTVIVIDAGHGGIDGGAVSVFGVRESQINLEIARRLDALFQLMGAKTHMIRCDDRSIYTSGKTIAQKKVSDLKERVRITNGIDNSVLISIHQNYYPDPNYFGPQVFYAATDNSKALAESIQSSFINNLTHSGNRKPKRAEKIYIMNHIIGDGVLIECGFLSNERDAQLLQTKDHQLKLAAIIVCTCTEYLPEDTDVT